MRVLPRMIRIRGVRRLVHRVGRPAVAMAAIVLLCSCSGRRALVFTTGTVIGVEASAEEGVEQHFVVGLKRFEGALVPTVVTRTAEQGGEQAASGDVERFDEPPETTPGDQPGPYKVRERAYSVFATLGFRSGLFKPTTIVQVFGTGRAAKILAGSPDAMANTVKAAQGMVADYNPDASAKFLRQRIETFINDETPDPDGSGSTIGDLNWEALRGHLDSVGVEASNTLWLYSASTADLDTAIQALGW